MEIKQESECTYSFWEGRLLLDQEVQRFRALHFPRQSEDEWIEMIRQWRGKNWLAVFPAIVSRDGRWKCLRCGADQEFIFFTPCGRCERDRCASCKHCLLLGRARSCQYLYRFVREGHDRVQIARTVKPSSIQLTARQSVTAQKLSTYVKQKMPTVLFWAVTGAGKTETMIPVIEPLIRQGMSVLWCTPRQDVVKELAPRLKRFFPDEIVTEHYAGSPDKWMLSPLVIATAHQTIRMAHLFDLVIVDEADAFPLEGNPALEYSIQRSKRTGGTIILLTATPTDLWIHRMRKGILPTVLLPCRFHGKPMPCPIWKREPVLWDQIKSHKMNRTVQRIINEITSTDGQALWFVPRIEDARIVAEWLKRESSFDEGQVDFVSSTDENRTEKMLRFRDRNILHLVTTTILERGITIPQCHAVVLRADHPVYDRASLVQIAGRVGRSLQYQAGKVWFLSNHKTEPICQAIREIQLLNREACKEFGG
ncbi:helicase-related protein [Thermoactinomyces sp. DSM 45892]|uniref:helicase-related protein n=1 Tax=Thermoactinomyces sp. DSM 45892 TaxID=1882753 RepID=UPI000896B796|nr:helicase-related protein [Thermoactinomyces sp. DSM 45892]SDZ20891.1 competence protein ComFA [Thermoactinomyces sp. DSM 45892]